MSNTADPGNLKRVAVTTREIKGSNKKVEIDLTGDQEIMIEAMIEAMIEVITEATLEGEVISKETEDSTMVILPGEKKEVLVDRNAKKKITKSEIGMTTRRLLL